jgi:hypothetical protein
MSAREERILSPKAKGPKLASQMQYLSNGLKLINYLLHPGDIDMIKGWDGHGI